MHNSLREARLQRPSDLRPNDPGDLRRLGKLPPGGDRCDDVRGLRRITMGGKGRDLLGDTPRTVFLQDADPLLMRPDDVVAVLDGLHERFPGVQRVTTYARSRTLARRSIEDLRRIRSAGLDRVHVGLESGCDAVLELIDKGATREDQIAAGLRAKEAGFELSEYVMPGLGGCALSGEHADDTAGGEGDVVRCSRSRGAPRP